MIDAKAFGAELAGIVKAATAPLIARIEELEAQVKEDKPVGVSVEEVIKAIPVPENGKDGEPGERGEKGEPGRDGLDVKDLFRADGGKLIAVMSDGTTKDLGVFVGADGKDGDPGKDGADGLGFEDMDFETDEHGRVTAKFQRGDIVKSVRLPGIVDRGPYRAAETYIKGDAVSYGGSLWIAQDDTSDKPDGGKGWRLAVKRGRDGKGA